MSPMPVELGSREIVLRLVLTVLSATLFGLDREGHGGPAGLRTTILVCLAASVAMIQANLLLPTVGRAQDSFVMLDLMRLPLGILSGVGFIGAGVIFRRNDLVVGVTTAASLWISTVIGLCFGGGQLALGAIATGVGTVVLWGLKWLDRYIPQELRAELILITAQDGPTSEDMATMIHDAGYQITGEAVHHHETGREVRYDLRWRGRRFGLRPPAFVAGLATSAGVHDVKWRPQGISERTG